MNFTPSNPFEQLLASASARFQVARADLEQYLAGEIRFTKCFNGLINSYDVSAAGHVIQLTPGQGAGCLTCTRERERELGYTPGSIAALVMCPAAAAAATRYTINRCWSKYGEAFEAWRRGEQAPEAEALPQPISPAALVASGLEAEYPQLKTRIAAALELVEGDTLDLAKYSTEWDNAGFYGCWTCSCPDAQHRGEALRTRWGAGCKHCLAGLIQQLVEKDQRRVAMQKLTDLVERGNFARPSDYRPKADPINRKASHSYQFEARYGR